MSRYGWSAHDGISPFASLGSGGVPAVTDEDFSYITSQDLEEHGMPSSRNYSSTYPPPRDEPRTEEPDYLLLKMQGSTHPVDFPAYTIGDGQLRVCDLRERIRILLNLSNRRTKRVRMLYKGRQLKEEEVPIRAYGVKNNSEIMVVVPDEEDVNSDSSGEEVVVVDDKRKRDKKKKKSKRRSKGGEPGPSDPTSPRLGDDLETSAPPSPAGSSAAGTGVSAATGASSASSASPAMKQLDEISREFTTKYLPLCVTYTANPPSDPKKRTDEHRKLSETVLQHVLLKLDGVDTNGEQDTRAKRKALVKQVQDVLKGLDEALKA